MTRQFCIFTGQVLGTQERTLAESILQNYHSWTRPVDSNFSEPTAVAISLSLVQIFDMVCNLPRSPSHPSPLLYDPNSMLARLGNLGFVTFFWLSLMLSQPRMWNSKQWLRVSGWSRLAFSAIHMRFRCDFDVQNLPQPTPHGFLVAQRCDKIPPR